jgi:hypothetical protein
VTEWYKGVAEVHKSSKIETKIEILRIRKMCTRWRMRKNKAKLTGTLEAALIGTWLSRSLATPN